MSREIKLRAWDIKEECYYYDIGFNSGDTLPRCIDNSEPLRMITFDDVIIEQYIGVKLKSKEVYVGDRVYIAGVGICVVRYSNDLLSFIFVNEETESEWFYHEVIEDIEEVVGNVHEETK